MSNSNDTSLYDIVIPQNKNIKSNLDIIKSSIENELLKEKDAKTKESLGLFEKCLYIKTFIQTSNANSDELMLLKGSKLEKSLNSVFSSSTPNSIISSLFYYNSIGIISLKRRKYSMAKYFFSLCLKILKQTQSNEYSKYYNHIFYNITLCSFYLGQYNTYHNVLSTLKNSEMMINNPYIYYRLALCRIESERQENSSNEQINNIVSSYLKETASVEKEASINANNNNNNTSTNQIRATILTNSQFDKNMNDNDSIIEAISNLKQCIILIKANKDFQKKILSVDIFNKSEYNNNNSPFSQMDILYNSAIVYLLYCLEKVGDYTEIIQLGKGELKKKNIHKKTRTIISNYLIYSHIKMEQFDEAKNILKSEIDRDFDEEDTFFFRNGSEFIYSKVKWKIAMYVSMVKLHFAKGEMQEGKKFIDALLSNIGVTEDNVSNMEIPGYILNLMVYYLITGNYKSICNYLIMYRKIPKEYFNI